MVIDSTTLDAAATRHETIALGIRAVLAEMTGAVDAARRRMPKRKMKRGGGAKAGKMKRGTAAIATNGAETNGAAAPKGGFVKGKSEIIAFVVNMVGKASPMPQKELSAAMKEHHYKPASLAVAARYNYVKKTAKGYVLGRAGTQMLANA